MLGEESKDDSDGHTIFSKQSKCNASTEMVRIILSTCLHAMEKCYATVECFKLFPPVQGTPVLGTLNPILMWNATFLRNEQ